jgi:hypothetical protein
LHPKTTTLLVYHPLQLDINSSSCTFLSTEGATSSKVSRQKMLKAIIFGTSLIMVNICMIAGAFVPDNANPFRNKNCCITHRRVTFLGSSDNNNNGKKSYGFFDDEEVDRQRDASQFIFDIDEDSRPEDVFIVLFNPDTDREGVHTLEYPVGSGLNKILAFESKEECEQFAASLKEQQFFDPKPQEMNLEALEDYCDQIGVDIQVVPEVS